MASIRNDDDKPQTDATPAPGASSDAKDTEAIAHDIAQGHAFDKHKQAFPGVDTPEGLQAITQEIMDRNEPRQLSSDRSAYWDDGHQAVVIVDPHHQDHGTIFKPRRGKDYYDNLD